MARRRKKNKAALPIGITVIILAVIGLITVITAGVKFVKNSRDDSAAKAKYEEWLKPVVMFDPDTFDDLTMADKSQLLYSAVWSLLQDENGMSKYPYSQGETIGILVPQADIEKAFISLYGNEIDIASLHSSIDMSGYDITYDAAQKSYILPITGVEAAYTPQVISIDKQGTSTILNVGYISGKAWADIEDGVYTAPEPDKYMRITVRERNGSDYISSIQSADSQEIAQQLKSTTRTVTQEDVPERAEEILPATDTQPQSETPSDISEEVTPESASQAASESSPLPNAASSSDYSEVI